jgi:hypothetical protein
MGNAMTEDSELKPRVIESFESYSPPFDVTKAVRRMLRDVPPKFLHGLDSIVLTNVAALSRQQRNRRTRGRGQRTTLGESLGYYSEAWKGEPAHITILVDNFEKQWGRSWLRLGLIRDFAFSNLLFHELGHHIHRVHRPKYEGPENIADKWSKKLSGKFMRDRYWYLFPVAVPISLILGISKDIAKLFRRMRR